MYTSEETQAKRNNERARDGLRFLRQNNAGRYGLKERTPTTPIIEGTTLATRKTTLRLNCETIDPANAVIFTGQCLVKKEEDENCPITLEDAIECELLGELVAKSKLPALCMLPDSVYASYISAEGRSVEQRTVSRAADIYSAFRKAMVPEIQLVRTSEIHAGERLNEDTTERLVERITRIYAGRVLKNGERHPVQKTILQYGLATLDVPKHLGYADKDIVVFAEPDEVCSMRAAEAICQERRITTKLALIGQIATPGLSYFNTFNKGPIRMFSGVKQQRIHLNENDDLIRTKLAAQPLFTLVTLLLSPRTTEEQLQQIGKSYDPLAAVEPLLEQVKHYKKIVEQL